MYFTIWALCFVGMFSPKLVDGYNRGCDFNQTIIAKDGATATFIADFKEGRILDLMMEKTSVATKLLLHTILFDISRADTFYFNDTWRTRTNVSSQLHSNNIRVRIDLGNVTMDDNGTYALSGMQTACFTLFILDGPSQPLVLVPSKKIHFLETGDIMPNVTCTSECNPPCIISWGEHGKGNILTLGAVTKRETGIYTCTATRSDGLTVEDTISIYVDDRPIQHLILVPEQRHYFLVTGDTMPDITCTSDCNPPCNISWGKNGKGNTLSLEDVTTESTGEYTCTATRWDGQTVKQSISIFITEKSYFVTAISCLGTTQALTILVLGLIVFYVDKRKVSSWCHRNKDSKKNEDVSVTFSTSAVQGSDNMVYEDLKDGTRTESNTYSEVNLSIIDDEAQPSRNKYENTRIVKKSTNVQRK